MKGAGEKGNYFRLFLYIIGGNSMLKKLFGKKETLENLVSPITGNILKIEAVPDDMFSQKMLGDGIAVEPTE